MTIHQGASAWLGALLASGPAARAPELSFEDRLVASGVFVPEVAALIGLVTGGLWAVTSLIVERKLAEPRPPEAPAPTAASLNLFKNAVALLVFGTLALVLGLEQPRPEAIGWLLFSGLTGFAIGDALYFQGLRAAGVQRASVVVLLHVPMTAVLGLVLLADPLSAATVAGMCVTLAGVVWVLKARGHVSAARGKGGVWFALGAAGAYALALTSGRHVLAEGDVVWGTAWRLVGAVAGALVVAPLVRPRAPWRGVGELVGPIFSGALRGRAVLWILALAVFGMALHHLALAGLKGAVAAVLFSTTPLFALLLERLSGNRVRPSAAVGTVVGFAGVAWILLSGLAGVRVERLPLVGDPTSRAFDLVAGADGRLHLLWTAGEDEDLALYHARLEDQRWSSPERAQAGAGWFVNWADFPRLSVAADGSALASFLPRVGEGAYDYHVHVAPLGGNAHRLHEDAGSGEHGFVSLTPLRAEPGRHAAVWLDGRETRGGGPMTLRAARLDTEGRPSDETLVDDRVCDCCQTSLVQLEDGRLLVAYRDREEDETRDIALRVSRPDGSDGAAWSDAWKVHDDGWVFEGCPVNGPVLANADGRVACAWFTAAGGVPRVLLARASERDLAFSDPVRLDGGLPLGRVDCVQLADGATAVTWLEAHDGAAQWRVRRVAADGSLGEPVTLAEVSAERTSGFGHLALDARAEGRRSALVFVYPSPRADAGLRSLRIRF